MSKKEQSKLQVPKEVIIGKILELRDEKVMLDFHLAELYGVENRALKQAVRRNMDLFPEDFMFVLTEQEIESMVSQNVIPSKQVLGGAPPFAFTETGVAMLSSVLKSARAKEMNITIMRTFVALRKMALNYREIMTALEEIRSMVNGHDKQINLIFDYLKQFEASKQQELEQKNRSAIGYKSSSDKNS
jgi:hypothetical protein